MNTIETKKVLVQWFGSDEKCNPTLQTRKYNNKDKAKEFIKKLPERGINKCMLKTTEEINLNVVNVEC